MLNFDLGWSSPLKVHFYPVLCLGVIHKGTIDLEIEQVKSEQSSANVIKILKVDDHVKSEQCSANVIKRCEQKLIIWKRNLTQSELYKLI